MGKCKLQLMGFDCKQTNWIVTLGFRIQMERIYARSINVVVDMNNQASILLYYPLIMLLILMALH